MAGKDPKKTLPPLHEYKEAKVCSKVVSQYGIDALRFNNICWIQDDIFLLSAGKFVQFFNLSTGHVDWEMGPENGGVGFVAVHPSRKFYVVGERTPSNPKIRVYTYPEKTLSFELMDGAISGFSACAFDRQGSRMATVATEPDYTLSLWDWEKKVLLLRNKCFSADVTTVGFSRFDHSLLVTGGSGHIKFWQTAKTFTGVKLQGNLGKFGRMEISNITAFETLPSGKVLSGSESGNLLLWEGDLIKCIFVKTIHDAAGEENVLDTQSFDTVHEGAINVLELIHDGKIVVTAGDDGFIRFWDRSELEVAEGGGALPLLQQKYLLQVSTGVECRIRSLTWKGGEGECVVLGSNGVIQCVAIPSYDEILHASDPTSTSATGRRYHFNGGGLTCSDVSSNDHTAVVGGEDSVLRLIDYVNGIELFSYHTTKEYNGSPFVFVQFLRSDPSGTTFLAGLRNGVLFLFQKGDTGFTLIQQWKPHTDDMTAVCVSPDEKFVCTLSENQTVFFFERTATCSLSPLGFCTTPLAAPLCIAWDVVGEGCLVGYKSGQLLAIPLPKEGAVDTAVSFEFECQYSLVGIRQRKLPPPVDEDDLFDVEGEDILEEKDDGPWAVQSILRVGDQYCIAMEKEELAYLYSCHIRYPGAVALPPLPPTGVEPPDYVEEPGENICYRDKLPLTVCRTLQPHTVTIVCSNGFVLVRDLEQLQTISVAGQAHDSTYFRQMTGLHISFDGSMIVSSGLDGLVVAQQVDGRPLPQVQARAVAPVRARVVEEAPPAVEAAVLSIQEQKEQDDKAKAEAAKQAIIDSFLKEIDGVHKEFTNILETNNSLPKGFQLSHAELRLDDQIEQYLQSEKEERVREARQGLLVDSVREDVRTHKLKKRFTDDLLYDRIKLFSFSNEFFVSTFRTPKGEEAIQRLEADIEDLDRSDDDESDQDNGKGGPEEEEESASAVEAPTNDKIPAERTVQTKGMSASVKQQLEKLDERRKERDERRKGYEVVLAKKPDPNVDDQKLARTLEKDIRERGECVLRTDPDYVSHDKDLKPTAKAKLQRLITLQKFVVELRTKFNVKFLEMREEKRGIIAALNKIVRRLREINALLGLDNASLSPFELTPEEQPESAFEMSREDLDEYSRVKQEEKVLAEEAKKAQRGFGADLAGATTTAREGSADARMSRSTRKESNKKSTQYSFSDRGSRASTVFASMNRERLSAELKVKLDNVKVSENEEEEREMRNAELKSEKAELERTAKAIQEDFDLKLFDLLQERGVVDSDICLSDLHLLLLFREYQLLLVFRSRDKELKRQLATLRDDSVTVEKNVESLRAKISDLEQVLARLQDEKKERKHVAETFIAEKFPADKTAYVLKVYNRKIKRKVNETDGEDDDITSDDEDEVEDEDDILEEICPPSCSVEAWERVLQLRNEKLDTQDALNMSKATSEKFSRQLGDLTNKDLVEIKENIKKCNDKKKELEKEKRKVLNMLDTIVPLRCNQIKCLNDEFRYPSHPGRLNVVVVSDSELLRLSSRLTELAAIKCERRAQLEDGASELEEVRQQKAQVQKVHASWEAKVHEVMMLKFGQHVDLEMLELCGASRRVESKKEELRQLELRWERELRKQENKIDGLRSRLQSRLIENTHLLQDFGTYEGERQQLQSSLAHSTANATNRFRSTRVATKEDRENLSELISAQQGEIAALTAEILMLKRKGGYAYNPSLY